MDCPQKVRHFLGAFFMGKSKYSLDFKLKAIKRYHKGDIGTDDLGKRIGVCGSLVRKWIKFYELYGVSGLVRLSNTHPQRTLRPHAPKTHPKREICQENGKSAK